MIQFQTDLLDTNPAYNDSIIRYYSTITGMTQSDIVISGIVRPFTTYPINETFSFNFKDIVKALINPNGFKDSILPNLNTGNFIYDDTSLQYILNATITTTNSLTADTKNVSYLFSKSVEQLINYNQKVQSLNDVVVLLPTKNNFDYNVTYFEGFPFDFSIRGLNSGDTFYFVNRNSATVSDTYSASTNDVKRVFLSDGAINETISNVLPLSSNHNLVELYVNDIHKANITFKKIESKCGVYLKWFNQQGAYSYWLFDRFYKENLKTKDLADINGRWDNLQSITSTSESLGKTATSTLSVSTNYEKLDKDYLLDVTKSPKVEMYVNNEPFIQQNEFNFIGVKVSDEGFQFNNKQPINKLRITLELPSINTITY